MWLRQATAGQEILLGTFLDSTDGDTEEPGLTIANTDIKLWKNGTTAQVNKNSGGATHDAGAMYSAVFDATDTNTLGKLEVNVHVAGALSVRREFMVLPANVYDALILGTDELTVDVVQWLGTAAATPTTAGVPEVDVTHVSGTAQTANDNGADINTILSRIIGTLASGTHNPASAAQIAVLSDWINAGRLDVILDIIAADVVNLDGAAMRGTDGANTVVPDAAGTAPTAVEIRQEMDTNSVDLNQIQTDIAALNNLSAAAVNAEIDTALNDFFTSAATLVDLIWDELVTGHTTNNTVGKILKGISEGWVADEGSVNDASATTTSFISDLTQATDSFFSDATVVFITGALKGQSRIVTTYDGSTKAFTVDEAFTSAPGDTDQFIVLAQHTHPLSEITDHIDTNSTQLAAIVADTNELQTDDVPGLIAALNDPTAAAVAAAVAAYDMGNGRTIEEALAFLRNKWTLSGGILTVYDTDDTTVLWTSAVTQTAGDPVSASDPT